MKFLVLLLNITTNKLMNYYTHHIIIAPFVPSIFKLQADMHRHIWTISVSQVVMLDTIMHA
jgi:hypothetical protein